MTEFLDDLAYFTPVRAWDWATDETQDETQVGAVPSGTGNIKDEAAGSQFKFGASQDGAGQVWGVRQPLVSCDSPYLSSASPGSSSDAASPFLRERAVSECEGSREQTGEVRGSGRLSSNRFATIDAWIGGCGAWAETAMHEMNLNRKERIGGSTELARDHGVVMDSAQSQVRRGGVLGTAARVVESVGVHGDRGVRVGGGGSPQVRRKGLRWKGTASCIERQNSEDAELAAAVVAQVQAEKKRSSKGEYSKEEKKREKINSKITRRPLANKLGRREYGDSHQGQQHEEEEEEEEQDEASSEEASGQK